MSYTAPAGNAVDFTATGASYSPPAGDAVNFTPEVSVIVSAKFELGAEAIFATPSELVVDTAFTLSPEVEFDATYKHVVLVAGGVALGGDCVFLQPADFRADAQVQVACSATLSGVPMLRANVHVALSAQAAFKVKRSISVAGSVRVSGHAQLRAAAKLVSATNIPVLCAAKFYARDNRG